MTAAVPRAPDHPESRGRVGSAGMSYTRTARTIQLFECKSSDMASHNRHRGCQALMLSRWLDGFGCRHEGVEASSRNKGKTRKKFAFNNRIYRSRKIRNTLYNIDYSRPYTEETIVHHPKRHTRRKGNRAVHIKTVCFPNPSEYHASVIPAKAVTRPAKIRKRSDEKVEGWQMGRGMDGEGTRKGLGTYCFVQAFCGFCRDCWNGCHGGVLPVKRR